MKIEEVAYQKFREKERGGPQRERVPSLAERVGCRESIGRTGRRIMRKRSGEKVGALVCRLLNT